MQTFSRLMKAAVRGACYAYNDGDPSRTVVISAAAIQGCALPSKSADLAQFECKHVLKNTQSKNQPSSCFQAPAQVHGEIVPAAAAMTVPVDEDAGRVGKDMLVVIIVYMFEALEALSTVRAGMPRVGRGHPASRTAER